MHITNYIIINYSIMNHVNDRSNIGTLINNEIITGKSLSENENFCLCLKIKIINLQTLA
jgi:hypothetical protein